MEVDSYLEEAIYFKVPADQFRQITTALHWIKQRRDAYNRSRIKSEGVDDSSS